MPGFLSTLICYLHSHNKQQTLEMQHLASAAAVLAQREGKIEMQDDVTAYFRLDKAHTYLDLFVVGRDKAVAAALPSLQETVLCVSELQGNSAANPAVPLQLE